MAKISIKYVIYNKAMQADGRYPVKLRVIFKRMPYTMATNLFVSEKDLVPTRKGKEHCGRTIKDANLKRKIEDLIRKYEDAANDFNPDLFPDWTVTQVVQFMNKVVNKECFRLDFPDFCSTFILEKTNSTSSKKAPANYRNALNILCAFMHSDHFDIATITSAKLREFESYLVQRYGKDSRTVSLCASHISTMFKAARLKYNSEEMDELLIKNPYEYYTVPKQPASKHRDVELSIVQGMINAYPSLKGRQRIGVAAFLLSFATMGMNVPDLYECERVKGNIHYYRHKTKERRQDDAEMFVSVPKNVKALFKEYSDKVRMRKHYFNFHIRYSSYDTMNDAVEKGLRDYKKSIKYKGTLVYYSARHTWATTARSSKCKLSSSLIDECLNHVTPTPMVDVYAKKDFSVYWDANEKVVGTLDWTPLVHKTEVKKPAMKRK
ncbi:MAG: site-specific integrase [Bacteroidales bacterium]|nr:site-specific integrase [Bacteroidales bacterium]